MKRKTTSDGIKILDAIAGTSKKMQQLIRQEKEQAEAELLAYDLDELERALRGFADRIQLYRQKMMRHRRVAIKAKL